MEDTFSPLNLLPPAQTASSKVPRLNRKTKALTLRMDLYWLKKLRGIARHLSMQNKADVNVQNLIRSAIFRTYISEDKRNIIRRESELIRKEKSQSIQKLLQLWGNKK